MTDTKQEAPEVVACKGINCGTTTGEHSPECLLEAYITYGCDQPTLHAALQDVVAQYREHMAARIAELEAERSVMPQMLAALRWYADPMNYRGSWEVSAQHAMEDKGRQARCALDAYDSRQAAGTAGEGAP